MRPVIESKTSPEMDTGVKYINPLDSQGEMLLGGDGRCGP